ncbi:hypothetical protein [Candidatus Nitrospira salsa]|nr:MAG: hypothetical protein NPIRA04_02300 [Nitrospirales bacterium]
MMSVLTSDQLEQELSDVRQLNRKLIREVEDVQKENAFLRRQILQDRQWIADALRILHEAQNQSVEKPVVSCSCGLEAVLQHAEKRAMDAKQSFGISKEE